MDDLQRLWNACDELDSALNVAVCDAVSFSCVDNKVYDKDGWMKVIKNKLSDLKLLNTKAIMLNTSILKDRIPINEDLTVEEAKIRLKEATEAHGRWNNALKMKAISRVIYLAYQRNDEEKKLLFNDLLTKLSVLNYNLNKLSNEEELKNDELKIISEKWRTVAKLWMEKKQTEASKSRKDEMPVNDGITSRLSQIVMKMEILKAIQGRLLGSCMSYDWNRDPDKLEQHLISSRRLPYKTEDFCN